MNAENEQHLESLEQENGNQQLKPAEVAKREKDTQTILRARREVLEDRELTLGAKALFSYLLDLSLNKYVNNWRRGEISISMWQLRERLNVGKSSLCGWVQDLERQRHIWVSKLSRSNTDAINVYHITALQPRKELKVELAGDPLWGKGRRRPASETSKRGQGQGFKKKTWLVDQFGHPLLAQHSENQHSPLQKLERGGADSGTGSAKNQNGELQKLDLPVPETRPARARNCNSPFQFLHLPVPKTEALGESQIKDKDDQRASLSCLTAEKSATTPPVAKQFSGSPAKKWNLDAEKEFLEELKRICGPKELANWGGRWRNRFREDRDKAQRVLAELQAMAKENRIVRNAGAAANGCWDSFASKI